MSYKDSTLIMQVMMVDVDGGGDGGGESRFIVVRFPNTLTAYCSISYFVAVAHGLIISWLFVFLRSCCGTTLPFGRRKTHRLMPTTERRARTTSLPVKPPLKLGSRSAAFMRLNFMARVGQAPAAHGQKSSRAGANGWWSQKRLA